MRTRLTGALDALREPTRLLGEALALREVSERYHNRGIGTINTPANRNPQRGKVLVVLC